MYIVNASEARRNLSRLLDRVEKGERITIVRRGVPVAVLEPAPAARKMSRSEAVKAMQEFGRGRSLEGTSIREMIDHGRK